MHRTVIEMFLIAQMKDLLDSILCLQSLHKNSRRNVSICADETYYEQVSYVYKHCTGTVLEMCRRETN